jgi:hypothetical protein
MSALSTFSKTKLRTQAAKGAVRNPGLARLAAQGALKVYTPIVKRRTRKRVGRVGETARSIGDTARTYGEMLVTHGPGAAQELGLVSAPKPKRTVPRVAAGVVIGAGAAYFLEPEHGPERREKALSLVG